MAARRPRLRLEWLEAREVPATVNATDDVDDYKLDRPKDWDGDNDQLSLPEAIRQVNKEGGNIDFAVDQVTISTTGLAPITRKVTITGKPGANGVPGTVLNGSNTQEGLTLKGGGTVTGLVIQAFSGVGLYSSGKLTLTNCYIGTSKDGKSAMGNGEDGVFAGAGGTFTGNVISGNGDNGLTITGKATVQNNKVGTDVEGKQKVANSGTGILLMSGGGSVVKGNVVSGNGGDGIFIYKGAATVEDNKIGTDVDGKQAVANSDVGLSIYRAPVQVKKNVISGNGADGVGIHNGSGTKILGNKIGVDVDGQNAVPNHWGVFIGSFAKGNTVGGMNPEDRNIISGNTADGVLIEMAGPGNKVLGNYVGLAADGTTAVKNGQSGVRVNGAPGTTIGGTMESARNLIAGNGGPGVSVSASSGPVNGTKVIGNVIGLDSAGDAKPNQIGVQVSDGATGTVIGGKLAGERNIISGNTGTGVMVTGNGVTGNNVIGNYIGTDADGTTAKPNSLGGVALTNGATRNFIGGNAESSRNLISGNQVAGVFVANAGPLNYIAGNYIGTKADGLSELPNDGPGIQVDQTFGTFIGGLAQGARNIISGNNISGVLLGSGSDSTALVNNYIGLGADGDTAVPNTGPGVLDSGATATQIGNPGAPRNVISGNQEAGVLGAGSIVLSIVNNYIGTTADGSAARPNRVGISLTATGPMFIGGDTPAKGNVISGNTETGIEAAASTGLNIQGNRIGTDPSGKQAVPNGTHGIKIIVGSLTSIGQIVGMGGGGGNIIAFNAGNGVTLDGGSQNFVVGNSIFGNGGLGIRLVNGANINMPTPGLTAVEKSGAGVIFRGTWSGGSGMTLNVYSNTEADPSGSGEGRVYLGSVPLVVAQDGTFAIKFPKSFKLGTALISVTVTGDGGTSEFSPAVR
jgi:parallel beta-helix repeat protein